MHFAALHKNFSSFTFENTVSQLTSAVLKNKNKKKQFLFFIFQIFDFKLSHISFLYKHVFCRIKQTFINFFKILPTESNKWL